MGLNHYTTFLTENGPSDPSDVSYEADQDVYAYHDPTLYGYVQCRCQIKISKLNCGTQIGIALAEDSADRIAKSAQLDQGSLQFARNRYHGKRLQRQCRQFGRHVAHLLFQALHQQCP